VTSQFLQYFFIHHTGGEGRERKVKRPPIHHRNHDISQDYATIYMNFNLIFEQCHSKEANLNVILHTLSEERLT